MYIHVYIYTYHYITYIYYIYTYIDRDRERERKRTIKRKRKRKSEGERQREGGTEREIYIKYVHVIGCIYTCVYIYICMYVYTNLHQISSFHHHGSPTGLFAFARTTSSSTTWAPLRCTECVMAMDLLDTWCPSAWCRPCRFISAKVTGAVWS
jgi:hypothetical protein